jgi:hypothetical protein
MAHESANSSPDGDGRLAFDFDAIIEHAQVFSRDAVAAKVPGEGGPYDPVAQTTDYMHQVVEAERKWETTIQQARDALLDVDPRSLYSAFFDDLARQLNSGSPRSGALARLLESDASSPSDLSTKHGRQPLPGCDGRGLDRRASPRSYRW